LAIEKDFCILVKLFLFEEEERVSDKVMNYTDFKSGKEWEMVT